jgi:Carboxypeptidase regulatory-like domain/Putative zinc-finger
MTHLRPDELSASLDGALQGAARERAERHLAACAACREALAALAEQDAALHEVLEHDPGEAYFETFAARVDDRMRAAGLTGAQSRLGREGGWGWLSSPRRLAWLGTAAVLVVGAAIVMISGQPERSLLQSPEILQRVEPPRSAGPSAKKESAPPVDTKRENEEARTRDERGAANGLAQAPPRPFAELVAGKDAAKQTEPAPANGRLVAPSRAQAVRRTASGEDVPVAKSAPFAAPPPTATSSEANLEMAKRAAQPMESQSAPRQSIAPHAAALDQTPGGSLCGRVVDNRQQPVPGATVALADRGLVATAGPDGRFCLDAPQGLHELSAMAVGYESARLQVRVEGPSSEALVTLRAISALESPGGLALRGGIAAGSRSFFTGPSTASRAGEAIALSARAESLRTAPSFDRAAEAWVLAASTSKDDARPTALYRAADARVKAWQLTPTLARRTAARRAIDEFLRRAPAGTERDQALAWRRLVRS